MAIPVEMPQLGNTVEECILARWLKRENDLVFAGDIVAEIETDKTTFEVASPVDGTVLARFFDEGALVPVFTNIFVIGEPGERVDPYRPGPQTQSSSSSPAASGQRVAPQTMSRTSEQPAAPPNEVLAGTFAAVSPRAGRLAARLGMSSLGLKGSGPGGRVLEQDVRRAHESRSRGDAGAPKLAAPVNAPTVSEGARPTALRATIARRMRASLASTAQYTLNASADATALLALRARLKAGAADGLPDITINDLVAFCAVRALLDVPALNAEYIDGESLQHADVHLGFAVDTPRGLLAPVIRQAQMLSIGDLSQRMKQLQSRAVDGSIAPDDLMGATFTISNLGNLGVEAFTPVINPPQVAILGIGAIGLKPVRRQGPPPSLRLRETSARRAAALTESIEFVDSIGLSLTCDHQVIDGAPGARFLQVLRQKIEAVESLVDL